VVPRCVSVTRTTFTGCVVFGRMQTSVVAAEIVTAPVLMV
jgi:hypothetical protein